MTAHIAALLAIPAGAPVIARQRLIPATDADWPTLSTVYLPATTAGGTAFHAAGLLHEDALDHLERRLQLVATDVVERLSARSISAREAALSVSALSRRGTSTSACAMANIAHRKLPARSTPRRPVNDRLVYQQPA